MAQNVIINGVTYSDVPEVDIPKSGGGTAKFYDASGANAVGADIRNGKIAYGASGEVVGTMPENTAGTAYISTKDQEVTIPQGYHSGSGKVAIALAEVAKLIAGNIKSGVTILGQAGSSMVQDTTIGSGAATASSILSGFSAWVNGVLVQGTMTAANVSQDSTSKVLSIS